MRRIAESYRTHGPLVRSYLRRLVPAQEVDDVAQVVFAEAWRSRHRYDPARDLAPWLLSIAHSRAVDLLRARRPPTVPLEAVAERAGADGRATGQVLAERDRVADALRELPLPQRQAIVLAYYGGLSQREISERLQIPLGTIKGRTVRGLRRLATLLEAA